MATESVSAFWPGSLYFREVPDGRVVQVIPMLYNARLIIGPAPPALYYEDAWCYATPARALEAAMNWDLEVDEEPSGWIKHPFTGRRRPDGDASREAVWR